MTIAISLKVNDGLVLAADSASTLMSRGPSGEPQGVVNVYNNANKVFNLRKVLPVGAITWGSGSIGVSSISTLAKDLRLRFAGRDEAHKDWHIDPEAYSIEEIAKRVREFMFEDRYVKATKDWPDGLEKPDLGFIIAGYSPGHELAEEYEIHLASGECPEPELVRPKDQSGVSWNGQPEAISRLILGFGTELHVALKERLGIPDDQLRPAVEALQGALTADLVQPAMPFQDAIDLAEFLVDLTINYSRFDTGAPTVGGPIEIAAISKHEGFKWIKRKHYYEQGFNMPHPQP